MSDAVTGKAKVVIVKDDDMDRALSRALELLGGIRQLIRPGDRVLIKPNFGVSVPPETGMITDPRTIEILIALCQDARPGRLLVGECGVVGMDTARIFSELGLMGRFEPLGAQLINLEQDETVEIPVPGGNVLKKVTLFKTAYESDVIISVPTMKSHILTGVTLGLKNMKGVLPDRMKKLMHRIGVKKNVEEFELERAIVDLNSVLAPSMTIIDGFMANEGYEPGTSGGIGGTPLQFETVVAGFDPVAVDAVGAYLMGFNQGEIRHIAYAAERGLGEADLSRIEILGSKAEEVRHPFKRPSLDGYLFDFKEVSLIAGQGCSGCRESALVALAGMSKTELEKMGSAAIVVGAHVKLTEKEGGRRLFFVGNCTGRCDLAGVRIEGCPPPGNYLRSCLLEGRIL
jgi:uncharacterized protein (DUF362 family)